MTDINILPATELQSHVLHDLKGDYVIKARRPKVFVRSFDRVFVNERGIAADDVDWLSCDFSQKVEPVVGPICTSRNMVLLGGNVNFGHWLFENLTRVAAIDRAVGGDIPIGIWSSVPQSFVDFLTMLRFQVRRVDPGWFEGVWIPSAPFGRTPDKELFIWPEASQHLRARFSVQRRVMQGRKVYAKRQARKRRILNDDDVVTCVKSHGFEVLDFAEMTAFEQIRTASECSVIVMPNGAGAPITMFTDGTIIELNNPQLDGPFGCRVWALNHGNPYHRIVGTPEENTTSIDVDYTIDIERLEQCLTSLP